VPRRPWEVKGGTRSGRWIHRGLWHPGHGPGRDRNVIHTVIGRSPPAGYHRPVDWLARGERMAPVRRQRAFIRWPRAL